MNLGEKGEKRKNQEKARQVCEEKRKRETLTRKQDVMRFCDLVYVFPSYCYYSSSFFLGSGQGLLGRKRKKDTEKARQWEGNIELRIEWSKGRRKRREEKKHKQERKKRKSKITRKRRKKEQRMNEQCHQWMARRRKEEEKHSFLFSLLPLLTSQSSSKKQIISQRMEGTQVSHYSFHIQFPSSTFPFHDVSFFSLLLKWNVMD